MYRSSFLLYVIAEHRIIVYNFFFEQQRMDGKLILRLDFTKYTLNSDFIQNKNI